MLKKLIGCALLVLASQSHSAQIIEHVGPVAHDELVQTSIDVQTNMMMAARTLFPSVWNGYAQKGLDIHRTSSLKVNAGEPWVVALERWLNQEQLNARLDWVTHKFYLRKPVVAQTLSESQILAQAQAQAQKDSDPSHNNATPSQAQAVASAATAPIVASRSEAQQGEAVAVWSILTSDVRLETTFERWAREGGYKLVWDAERHILISAADQFRGTITQAIERVLSSPAIRDSDYPLEAVFYSNNPPVIRITRLGDQPIKE